MGLRLCPYHAALLPGGVLFLLLLADPALPVGRPPPVVLGEARVQSWVRVFVRPAGRGAGAGGLSSRSASALSMGWGSI